MTLANLAVVVRRHFLLIALTGVMGLVVSFLMMRAQPVVYTASSTAQVNAGIGASAAESFQSVLLAQQKARSYRPLFSSRVVGERVAKALKLPDSPASLASRVDVTLPADDVNLLITASGSTPESAKALADAVVVETAAYAAELDAQVVTTTAEFPAKPVKIVPVESALLPGSPSSPRADRFLPLGLFLGLAGGFGLAFLKNRRDTRVRSGRDVEESLGVSVLGMLAQNPELLNLAAGSGSVKDFSTREALRKLRTNLRFVNVDSAPRSIVVSSAHPSEGKSTVSGHLAKVLAESGQRVILVDADLRRPEVAKNFGLDGGVGLTQVLAGTVALEDAVQPSGLERLDILPAGSLPPNPSELLGSQRLRKLIDRLTGDYFVIFDAPPLLPVTDAALLSEATDGVLLVVRANQTRREDLTKAANSIWSVKGTVIGGVLNGLSGRRWDRLRYGDTEYGDSGYGYYYRKGRGRYGYGKYGYSKYGYNSYSYGPESCRDAKKQQKKPRK